MLRVAIWRTGALMALRAIMSSCRVGVAVAVGALDGGVLPRAGGQGGEASELGLSALAQVSQVIQPGCAAS